MSSLIENNNLDKINDCEKQEDDKKVIEQIDIYKKYLEESFYKYYTPKMMKIIYGRVPLSRYYTFRYCIDAIRENNFETIVELGTSRSFVDGAYEGCNSDDIKYWYPNDMEKWDWSAGIFTYVFGEEIKGSDAVLHTVDLMSSHIERSKIITKKFKKNIEYHVSSSEDFLNNFDGKIDLLYLDTGDMNPIEPTAELQLRESMIVVERNLINPGGIILIDDVRNPAPKKYGEKSDFGKAKYSIPYLVSNGFDLVMDEYQVILRKM